MKNRSILKVSLRGFTPKTRRTEVMKKKRELRDAIIENVPNIAQIRKLSRGRPLAIRIVFFLYQGSGEEGRVKKDLDNLMKIVLDTLPDHMDRAHTEPGLGLIEGDSDHLIYELTATKNFVHDPKEEGIDIELLGEEESRP